MSHSEPSQQITAHARLMMQVPDGCHLCAACKGHGCHACQASGIVKDAAPVLTADIYGQCEIDIANAMTRFPQAAPNRLAAIRQLRDGMASVIADDVAARQTPNPGTVARYSAFVQLLADEVGA